MEIDDNPQNRTHSEPSLQEALNRIYRPTGLVRKPMKGPLSESYAQWYYPQAK